MKNIIETQRLNLRLLNKTDVKMIFKLLNEPTFIENIGDKGIKNLHDALNYIEQGPLAMYQELGFCLYCCQLKGVEKTIGISGLIKRDGIDYPEVGFAFLQEYCHQGFGYESANVVLTYAKEKLNIKLLNAICNPSNIGSINLLHKLGFTYQGNIKLDNKEEEVKLFEIQLI